MSYNANRYCTNITHRDQIIISWHNYISYFVKPFLFFRPHPPRLLHVIVRFPHEYEKKIPTRFIRMRSARKIWRYEIGLKARGRAATNPITDCSAYRRIWRFPTSRARDVETNAQSPEVYCVHRAWHNDRTVTIQPLIIRETPDI